MKSKTRRKIKRIQNSVENHAKNPTLLTLCVLLADEKWDVLPIDLGDWLRIILYVIAFYLIKQKQKKEETWH